MSDDDLEAELRRLRSEVEALRHRVAALEETGKTDGPPTTGESDTPSTTGETNATPTSTDVDTASTTAARGSDPTSDEPIATPVPSEAVEASTDREDEGGSSEGRDWERDLGIKWLGLVGGVALVVGVVFFVRLAIEAGLLGPLGRVVVGAIGGLALFAGGRFAAEQQGHVRWGRIAAGTGLAIAYFSVYASYGFETYRTAIGTPLWAVLLALTALVVGAVAASVRDGAPIVVGEAFFLGYGTAFLSLEFATFVVTPAYVLLLTFGLVAISTIRPWSRLVAGSVFPTYGVVLVWRVDVDPAAAVVAGVLLATFGIYLAGGYVLRASGREDRWHPLQVSALTALNAVSAAILLEITLRNWFPNAPVEGIALGVVAAALVGVYAVTDRRPVRRDDTAGVLAVVLFAGGIVLATGTETFAATVGLLAVVCAAVAAASLADAAAFRTGAHLVAAGTVYKLLIVDATALPGADAAEPLATATGRAAAFALGIVVCYGLAGWFREETATLPGTDEAFPTAAPYALAGTGLTVVVLWLELSGLGVSVAWAVFGLVLVGAGLATDVRGLRLLGIAVLGLATAKVFLHDTRDLDTLARTLSFIVLGGILLAASYAYARWKGEDPLSRLAAR